MANNTESTYPIQSGSNIDFPLSKTVISNQAAKEKIEASFNEITLSEEKFDSEKIKGIYNDLFYLIPKQGKKSHTSIIDQSTDYVYPEINQNLEDSITAKEETLLELNNTYLSGSIPKLEPIHPIYDNGLLVQAGTTFPYEPNSDIWYTQQGFKRKLGRNSAGHVGGYWHRLLRQAEGEEVLLQDGSYKPLKDSPNFRYLTTEDLNSIPNGEDIDDGGDLNRKKITDRGDDFIYNEIKIELICKGKEMFYKYQYGEDGYDYDLSGYPETGGYWWLDTEGYCKVRVERDIDPTTDYKPIIGDISIKGGTSKTITISRDAKFYPHEINGTSDPLNSDFYDDYDGTNNYETRSGYGQALPTMQVDKLWGPGKLYPSITNVYEGSRLKYRMKSPYNQQGQIVDSGGKSHWLQRIIDDRADTDQDGILDSPYDRDSNFGTRMINDFCHGPSSAGGCYGSLGQSSALQGSLFNSPTSKYYQPTVSFNRSSLGMDWVSTHNIYGQPILRVKNDDDDWKYCVLIDYDQIGNFDWYEFYDLSSGNRFDWKNKKLDDKVFGYERLDNNNFVWTKTSGKLNNPKLYYPGLQGARGNVPSWATVGYAGDFNPDNENGSNYKLTDWMKNNLDLA